MACPDGSFIWYELMTTDADAAARFYGAVVGWTVDAHGDPTVASGEYRMIRRDDGREQGGVFALTPQMVAGGARPAWVAYLQVADVDAAVKAIEAEQGRALMPKMSLPVGEMAMVTDSTGAPFYVMAPVPPPGQAEGVSDVFDGARPQHVRWNELQSADPQRAKAFYSKLFGFDFNAVMPMGEWGDYLLFDVAGVQTGGVMKNHVPGAPDAWQFYFGVASVTAARSAIQAHGGTIDRDLHQEPGGDWVVLARDPQGAAFGIVGPKGDAT